MTPTLQGRWQMRIFLLPTIGLVISLVVALIIYSAVPMFVLLYVLLFGLLWDVLYQAITSYRWDRDWPTSFQVMAGVIEGALIWVLLLTGKLPGIPQTPPFLVFLIQYGLTWLSIFILVQGPLRIIWLKWRYQGGQWFVSRPLRPGQAAPQQQPVLLPQEISSSNPRLQTVGEQANLPNIRAFVCECGFTLDRIAVNFCPRCGRPKVQQGVY